MNPAVGQHTLSDRKLSVLPIIANRLLDREAWSFPSVKGPIGTNTKGQAFDITQQYDPMPEVYETFRPDTFTNFSLDSIPQACSAISTDSAGRVVVKPDPSTRPQHPKVIHPMSYSDEGNWQTFPTAPSNYLAITSIPNGQIPLSAYRTDLADSPNTMSSTPWSGNNEFVAQGTGAGTNTDASIYLAQQALQNPTTNNTTGTSYSSAVEGFTVSLPNWLTNNTGTPVSSSNDGSPGTPVKQPGTTFPVPQYMPPGSTSGYGIPTGPAQNLPTGPPTDFLIPQTVNSIYGPNAVTPEERVKYLTTIEPSSYTYSDTATPINGNIGISYNPDLPPLVRDQVATPIGGYPLYHRIDPQLIRDAGLPSGRLAEMPQRGAWSARYSNFQAQPSVNMEEIYDPRFNSYGDGQRSYFDTVSGNVKYYYSDVDAYRNPLFQGNVRSSVDHVMFTDPMGVASPEYARNVGVSDVRDAVEGTFLADTTFFRENLSEAQMRKSNARMWQLRYGPLLQRGANRHHATAAY
jgi:hypothetical protein